MRCIKRKKGGGAWRKGASGRRSASGGAGRQAVARAGQGCWPPHPPPPRQPREQAASAWGESGIDGAKPPPPPAVVDQRPSEDSGVGDARALGCPVVGAPSRPPCPDLSRQTRQSSLSPALAGSAAQGGGGRGPGDRGRRGARKNKRPTGGEKTAGTRHRPRRSLRARRPNLPPLADGMAPPPSVWGGRTPADRPQGGWAGVGRPARDTHLRWGAEAVKTGRVAPTG